MKNKTPLIVWTLVGTRITDKSDERYRMKSSEFYDIITTQKYLEKLGFSTHIIREDLIA